MVDIAGLPAGVGPQASDFQFRVGNTDDPQSWIAAPAADSITVRRGEGAGGSDRVTIVWHDGDVRNRWLEVTVLPRPSTGLPEADVFYFGNAVGEAGDSATDAKVNAADMLAARDNPRSFLNPAPIDFNYDFNRDARVNATDMLIARDNPTHFLNALRLISVPTGQAGGAPQSLGGAPVRQSLSLTAANQTQRILWLCGSEQSDEQDQPAGRRATLQQAIDWLLAMHDR